MHMQTNKRCYFGYKMHIVDGGLATTLENKGWDINSDPLWSARFLYTNPQAILDVHKEFYDHGADVAITASYQTSIESLCHHLGISTKEAQKLIRSSVMLAKQARQQSNKSRDLLVAGSVGPYGACLHDGSEYTGSYIDTVSLEFLKEWHRPRVKLLIEEGVDVVAVETQPCLKEVLVVLQLLKEYPDTKFWISFACKDMAHTNGGEQFDFAVTECWKQGREQIVAVGINCTDPQYVDGLLSSARQTLNKEKLFSTPFIVYPNSGELWSPDKGWYGQESCEPLSSYALTWLHHGVEWIGGCCRTSPASILQLKNCLQ